MVISVELGSDLVVWTTSIMAIVATIGAVCYYSHVIACGLWDQDRPIDSWKVAAVVTVVTLITDVIALCAWAARSLR